MGQVKYYTLTFPRPIGVEPTVYTTKPIIESVLVEVEPGYFLEDPYSNPEIDEFESVKDALDRIIEFNGTDEYLKEIKIK
jgi:hypothetical protein